MSRREQIIKILADLTPDCGVDVSYIRREIMGDWNNRRSAAGILRYELELMESEGLVKRLDQNKPVAWCLTRTSEALKVEVKGRS